MSVPPDTAAMISVPALLSVATVAEILALSERTVRRRIEAGELPAVVDHGRVLVRGDELRRYVDALERFGAGPRTRRRRTGPTARRTYDFLT